jgi:glyoxylase I family protein
VRDTLGFYREVFDLPLGHIWGRKGKVYLLHLGDNSYLEINEEEDAHAEVTEGPWSHICLKTADIEDTYRRALAAGAQSVHAAYLCSTEGSVPRAPACYMAAVKGLEGESIGLIQELGVPAERDVTRMHHIGIHTPDVHGLADFYKRALGLNVGRYWQGAQPSCMIDLGGNCFLEVNPGTPYAGSAKGYWAHVALKSVDPEVGYARAMSAGAADIHPCFLCDVVEAQPKPVQWRSASFKGPEGEAVSLMDDLAPGVWEAPPVP